MRLCIKYYYCACKNASLRSDRFLRSLRAEASRNFGTIWQRIAFVTFPHFYASMPSLTKSAIHSVIAFLK